MTLFPGSIYGGISQLGTSRKAAGAVSWWLSGGIAAANCIAAYQPKGAADYAASKVNLANPGTYNATDGKTGTTWDATSGWIMNGACSLYTGLTPSSLEWTIIARFSDVVPNSNCFLICSTDAAITNFLAINMGNNNKKAWFSGTAKYNVGVFEASGVMGLAYLSAYFNGSPITDLTQAGICPNRQFVIGGISTFGSLKGNLQALAIYDTTLSAAQVAALSTAMAAL